MTRRRWWSAFGLSFLGLGSGFALLSLPAQLWPSARQASSNLSPGSYGSGISSTVQAAPSEAETLEQAFIRIGQQVGPAVVSISTEQIERVRQYFRVHPFFGPDGDPFEEFFQQFYGNTPQQEFHRFGLGSGVIIDPKGFILTNEHVVADADKITVTLSDGRELTGIVKGKDSRSDLAVIQINAQKLPVASLGDSNTVKTGQWAVALGNPFGLMGSGPGIQAIGTEPTLTVGIVSALNRQLPSASRYDRDYSGLIQTDAAINPGNSGGPLLNLKGQVIGINVAILTSSRGYEGIGFAIPINKVKDILDALIEGREIIYGWLGIQIQDLGQDVAEFYGLPGREGVLIYQVLPASPAKEAGLQDGDIIQSFNHQPVRHSRQLIEGVSRTPAGTVVELEVLREGRSLSLKVKIGERPGDLAETAGVSTTEFWRGLKVSDLSAEYAERFHLPADATGILVIEIEQNSPAEEAGLRPGDLINEINRTRINNVSEYRRAIATVKDNALVRTTRGYVVIKTSGQ